jgi:hypothetical protein
MAPCLFCTAISALLQFCRCVNIRNAFVCSYFYRDLTLTRALSVETQFRRSSVKSVNKTIRPNRGLTRALDLWLLVRSVRVVSSIAHCFHDRPYLQALGHNQTRFAQPNNFVAVLSSRNRWALPMRPPIHLLLCAPKNRSTTPTTRNLGERAGIFPDYKCDPERC